MTHRMTITRRAALLGVAAAIIAPQVSAQSAQTGGTPRAAATDAILGMSKHDAEETLTQTGGAADYGQWVSPVDETTPMSIQFDDQVATSVEFVFSPKGTPGEGVSPDVALSHVQAAMGGKLQRFERFFVRPNGAHMVGYAVDYFVGEPNIICVQETGNTSVNADPKEFTEVYRATVGLPGTNAIDLAPTGDPGGLGLPRAKWVAEHGEPEKTDAEHEVYAGLLNDADETHVFFMPQADMIQRIEVLTDDAGKTGVPAETARTFAAGALFGDCTLIDEFFLPATQTGPLAVRAVRYSSPTAAKTFNYEGSVLALFFEKGAGPEPTVSRLLLQLNDTTYIDAMA